MGLKANPKLYRIYQIWYSMIRRCDNPKAQAYKRYGGRGIKVCSRWHNLDTFIADMGIPDEDGLELDRINNNGNYEPSNCRWATPQQQARNRRNNRVVTFNGVAKLLVEWQEQSRLTKAQFSGRFDRGWPMDKILSTPVQIRRPTNGVNAQKRLAQEHRKAGLCEKCKRVATHGVLCEIHYAGALECRRKRKARLAELRRNEPDLQPQHCSSDIGEAE